ncbi:MAG: GNAT family N-acetyltransferase [Cyanobacteria bacterium J06621_8]
MNIFLETPRLFLRDLIDDDLDHLVELDKDPEVMRYINGGIAVSYQAIANNFLPYVKSYNKRKDYGFWAMIDKSSQEFIGWIFLRPEIDFELLRQLDFAEADATEIGYRIRQSSWNQGYTTEAAKILIEKSFTESEITKIVAWALAENRASTRVMEKVGLKLQQEYLITTDMLPANLLENNLIQNVLNRPFVRYQLINTVCQET